MVSHLYLKNELSYEVSFLHVVGVNRSNKFNQLIQVDVVRHAKSDSKQHVRYFVYK